MGNTKPNMSNKLRKWTNLPLIIKTKNTIYKISYGGLKTPIFSKDFKLRNKIKLFYIVPSKPQLGADINSMSTVLKH